MATKKKVVKKAAAKKTAKKAATAKKNAVAKKKAPAKEAAAKKPAARQVRFVLKATGASWASLVGEFNGWDINAGGMKRDKDGLWVKSLRLKPGRYEYKYVVDGEWWSDPDNPDFVYNEHGTTNSICVVE